MLVVEWLFGVSISWDSFGNLKYIKIIFSMFIEEKPKVTPIVLV